MDAELSKLDCADIQRPWDFNLRSSECLAPWLLASPWNRDWWTVPPKEDLKRIGKAVAGQDDITGNFPNWKTRLIGTSLWNLGRYHGRYQINTDFSMGWRLGVEARNKERDSEYSSAFVVLRSYPTLTHVLGSVELVSMNHRRYMARPEVHRRCIDWKRIGTNA